MFDRRRTIRTLIDLTDVDSEQHDFAMTATLDIYTASHRKQLSQLSLQVAKSKRILVVTGAGISCSSGIPVRDSLLIVCMT